MIIFRNIICFLWIAFVFTFLAENSHAQKRSVSALQSAFLLQFPHYIKWPKQYSKFEEFKITIIGNKDVYETLLKLAKIKKVKDKKINVAFVTTIEEVKDSHIIFYADHKSDKSLLANVKTLRDKYNSVLITNYAGATRIGFIINFYLKNEKLKFEIDNKAAQTEGLKINSRLLALGRAREN